MQSYKTFDFYSQVIVILAIVTGWIADNSGTVAGVSLIVFAILQIISLLVHLFRGQLPWKEKLLRKIHIAGVGIVVLVMLYGLYKPPEDKYDMSGLGIIVYALIPAGIVALFYTVITFIEWKKLKNSP